MSWASSMTRCPWSSARALRTEASGPGARPATAALIGAQPDEPQHLSFDPYAGQALAQDRVVHAAAASDDVEQVGNGGALPPQRALPRQRYPFVAERHLGQGPPSVHLAHEVLGGKPHLVEEHLVEGVITGHVDDGADRDTWRVHGTDEVGDPLMFRDLGIGARQQDPERGDVREARPHLLPRDDPLVAVTHGPGGQSGQVRARAGLGEQLAPDFLTRQQREEIPLLLGLGPGMDQGGTRPADADLVEGTTHAGETELVVDDELGDGIGIETPRTRPVRSHISRCGELTRRWGGGCPPATPGTRLGPHDRLQGGRGPQRSSVGWPAVTDWNFADVWEAVADTVPDALCAIHGERRLTWSDTERRANGIARFLLDLGVAHQDKVAHYLYNAPEYMESTFAILKAALVPVNTNYRYTEDELVYLWDNADAVAVIFHGTFTERIAGLMARVPRVRAWLWVDDGTDECPSWATPYERAAESTAERVEPPWPRSGDDLYFLYTGGTTGMPKGVMWRQDDLFAKLNAGNLLRVPEDGGLEGVRKTIVGSGPLHLPACPLMHGTGGFTSMAAMTVGGCVVTLVSRHFDPIELLDTIDRDNVNTIAIVGDAFAKPILRTLQEHPGRWRLSTLLAIVSSGVMWSEETKRGLLHHHPTSCSSTHSRRQRRSAWEPRCRAGPRRSTPPTSP